MTARIFDDRACALGEGLLWHPVRNQLFWFDIFGKRLLTRTNDGPQEWAFDEHVSAAGWIDRDRLLIASETGLWRFDLTTGAQDLVTPLEADDPATRSNDGRADPWGGFWIGTMGKRLEPRAGKIYRWFRGELRMLFAPITIPNAICFDPNRQFAIFTDTRKRRIMRQPLDADGWPYGDPQVFVDLTRTDLNPDGAVMDTDGRLWVAQWGASRVACYDVDGAECDAAAFPALQISCPAFGGADLSTLFATSAADDLPLDDVQGRTFSAPTKARGQAEHQVKL